MAGSDSLGSAPTIGPSETSGAGPSAPPSVVANRYTILGLLGAGGMGRVYRAHDRSLDEVVALKMLRRELLDVPGALDRFRQEVKLARRVTSPHVVRTYDLGEHDHDHFLTMEYVEGRSLARCLDESRLPIDEILRVARAGCAGMTAAHAAGVLHRDLKPDNILVAKDGRVAITDFGLARARVEAAEGLVGTPAYMAPEQVEPGAAIGPAADVYAFGAILFEMLTGVRPFTGHNAIEVARARLERAPPDPRRLVDLPTPIADLVLRCLARDPSARFADGGALGVALAAIVDFRVTSATPQPRPDVPARTSRGVLFRPLVADEGLEEVAAGLSEEIIDALAMTRDLRVVPLATARKLAAADPHRLGKQLDVDVVVEGALRRRADAVRLTARVIGVVDGFQLWASHFDAVAAGLLALGDDVARAIAGALTAEIELPPRAAPLARAIELYLEGKAHVRAHWFSGRIVEALETLEPAAQLAPGDPAILATLSIAHARGSFLHSEAGPLIRARELAERAVAAAPVSGEPWLALGIARHYAGETSGAAFAFCRAISCAPGIALAQHLFGAVLLEAGALSEAIAHLEAATAIDPVQGAVADLPRAYIFSGRWDEAFALLEAADSMRFFTLTQVCRFRMWRGELSPDLDFSMIISMSQGDFARMFALSESLFRTGQIARADREELERLTLASTNPRLRLARLQFLIEIEVFLGEHDAAIAFLETAVDAGLQDYLWLTRCPILEPLRERSRFRELEASLAARAEAVLAAVRSARA